MIYVYSMTNPTFTSIHFLVLCQPQIYQFTPPQPSWTFNGESMKINVGVITLLFSLTPINQYQRRIPKWQICRIGWQAFTDLCQFLITSKILRTKPTDLFHNFQSSNWQDKQSLYSQPNHKSNINLCSQQNAGKPVNTKKKQFKCFNFS